MSAWAADCFGEGGSSCVDCFLRKIRACLLSAEDECSGRRVRRRLRHASKRERRRWLFARTKDVELQRSGTVLCLHTVGRSRLAQVLQCEASRRSAGQEFGVRGAGGEATNHLCLEAGPHSTNTASCRRGGRGVHPSEAACRPAAARAAGASEPTTPRRRAHLVDDQIRN